MSAPSEPAAVDLAAYIRTNLRLAPAQAVPEIVLWQTTPASRVRLVAAGVTPYWAYQWAGGTALARFILDRPQTVAKRRVLDLGCGGGLVAIAAARAGASRVLAVDVDPSAAIATALNAAANDVSVGARCGDLLDDQPPEADVILVGDLFYEAELARRVCAYLGRCRAAGLEALIGDPYRAHLPLPLLTRVSDVAVPDFGGGAARPSGVFTLKASRSGDASSDASSPSRAF